MTLCRIKQQKILLSKVSLIERQKLQAEGSMCEVQTVTGWLINTREFTISLTADKLNMWSLTIEDIIKRREAHHKEMDSLIGRLNHAGYIR